jgi:hypothetical protein
MRSNSEFMKNTNVRMVGTKIYFKVHNEIIRLKHKKKGCKIEDREDFLNSIDQKAINALVKIYFFQKYSYNDRKSSNDKLTFFNDLVYEEYSNPLINFALRHNPEVALFLIRINRVIKNRYTSKGKINKNKGV